MGKQNFTSKELSKKLVENGCKLKSKYVHGYFEPFACDGFHQLCEWNDIKGDDIRNYPAYDLLWDICVKYAREFFGEAKFCEWLNRKECPKCGYKLIMHSLGVGCGRCDFKMSKKSTIYQEHINCGTSIFTTVTIIEEKIIKIIELLQQNKKQEAEEYLWTNCLFNPKNK